jgi:large subunit ribosomal protein L29
MKSSEIRELSVKDIEGKISSEELVYNRMKLNHAVSPLENNQSIRVKRREIARLKTILREKQLSEK